jgi:hypothetical protein
MMALSRYVVVAVALFGCSSSSEDASNSSSGTTAQCTPALGTSPSGCPEAQPAEAAFAKIKSTCGVVDGDLDATNPSSPTLTAAGKAKLCTTCDCRTAVYAYKTLYAKCTGSDEGNTAFAQNLYSIAAACK